MCKQVCVSRWVFQGAHRAGTNGWAILALDTTSSTCTSTAPALLLFPHSWGEAHSQNHRIVRVGRDLWRRSSPIPRNPGRVTYSGLHGNTSAWGLSISRGKAWELRGLSRCSAASNLKEVLPYVEVKFLIFMATGPLPVSGHHWRVWHTLSAPTSEIFVCIAEIPLSVFSKQAPALSSHKRDAPDPKSSLRSSAGPCSFSSLSVLS